MKLSDLYSCVPLKAFVLIEIIGFFKSKLKDFEKDIADILKEEEEDKQVR